MICIRFLDLNIYVEDGYLKTTLFSKPKDNHEYLNVRSWHQDSVFRSIPTTVANRIRRHCTDDGEFTKSRSEYSGYLTNAGYKTSSISMVQETKEQQLKTTAESCHDNSCNSSNRISSFTPTYYPITKDVHKVIRDTLRVTLESSDSLKQILPVDSIKLSSKRDRNLKETLAPAVPHAHRQTRKGKGACSKCYNQRCGLCKIGILAETNRFSSFTIKHKYHICRITRTTKRTDSDCLHKFLFHICIIF